jgi:hypothetical protein
VRSPNIMTDQLLPFGGRAYFFFLAVTLFARGMDFLSTWVATPNLVLEGNPLAKKMGWRGGLIFNAIFCGAISVWPLPAIMVSVMSLLVAARNFQSAWIMRSMGEAAYSMWMYERLTHGSAGLFTFCIVAQSALTALVGFPLMYLSDERSITFAVGSGICAYAIAVLFFSLLSLWRIRRG